LGQFGDESIHAIAFGVRKSVVCTLKVDGDRRTRHKNVVVVVDRNSMNFIPTISVGPCLLFSTKII